jgi:hypothetical protein
MADVNATATIFRFFFEARQECRFFYAEGGEPFRPLSIRQVVANDSDESGSDDGSESEKDVVVQVDEQRGRSVMQDVL